VGKLRTVARGAVGSEVGTGVLAPAGEPALRGYPAELTPTLDAAVRASLGGRLAEKSLLAAQWLPGPAPDAYLLRYGTGDEEADQQVVVRYDRTADSASIVEPSIAAVVLNFCWRYFRPPARMLTPITRSTLPMIDPVIEALTTSKSPFRNAMIAIISSAALPNVAFRSPPMPSPSLSARCSVARPIHPARGTMASAEAMKIASADACDSSRAIATGTNTSSQLSRFRGARASLSISIEFL